MGLSRQASLAPSAGARSEARAGEAGAPLKKLTGNDIQFAVNLSKNEEGDVRKIFDEVTGGGIWIKGNVQSIRVERRNRAKLFAGWFGAKDDPEWEVGKTGIVFRTFFAPQGAVHKEEVLKRIRIFFQFLPELLRTAGMAPAEAEIRGHLLQIGSSLEKGNAGDQEQISREVREEFNRGRADYYRRFSKALSLPNLPIPPPVTLDDSKLFGLSLLKDLRGPRPVHSILRGRSVKEIHSSVAAIPEVVRQLNDPQKERLVSVLFDELTRLVNVVPVQYLSSEEARGLAGQGVSVDPKNLRDYYRQLVITGRNLEAASRHPAAAWIPPVSDLVEAWRRIFVFNILMRKLDPHLGNFSYAGADILPVSLDNDAVLPDLQFLLRSPQVSPLSIKQSSGGSLDVFLFSYAQAALYTPLFGLTGDSQYNPKLRDKDLERMIDAGLGQMAQESLEVRAIRQQPASSPQRLALTARVAEKALEALNQQRAEFFRQSGFGYGLIAAELFVWPMAEPQAFKKSIQEALAAVIQKFKGAISPEILVKAVTAAGYEGREAEITAAVIERNLNNLGTDVEAVLKFLTGQNQDFGLSQLDRSEARVSSDILKDAGFRDLGKGFFIEERFLVKLSGGPGHEHVESVWLPDSSLKAEEYLPHNKLTNLDANTGILEVDLGLKKKIIFVYHDKELLFTGFQHRSLKGRYEKKPEIVGFGKIKEPMESQRSGRDVFVNALHFKIGPLIYYLTERGREIFASLDTSAEIPIPLDENQSYQAEDPSGFKIGGVNSTSLIEDLTNLTGIFLEELERRARLSGILKPETSLPKKLGQDNVFVLQQKIGGASANHQELAKFLFYAMNILYETDASSLEYLYQGRRYRATKTIFGGEEPILFEDGLVPPRPQKAKSTRQDLMPSVRAFFSIVNVETGMEINFPRILAHHIWRYGFYYDLTPQDLIDMLDPKPEKFFLLRAKRGETYEIKTAEDLEQVARISDENLRAALPSLNFRIEQLRLFPHFLKFLNRHSQLAAEIQRKTTFRILPFLLNARKENLAAFLETWNGLPDPFRTELVNALTSIELGSTPGETGALAGFLDQAQFDPRLISKIELKNTEAAYEWIRYLRTGSRKYEYAAEAGDSPLEILIQKAVERILQDEGAVETQFLLVETPYEMQQIMPVLKVFEKATNLPINQSKGFQGSSVTEGHYVSFALGYLELLRHNQTKDEIEVSNIGRSPEGAALIGLVGPYFYALTKDQQIRIAKISNIEEVKFSRSEVRSETSKGREGKIRKGFYPSYEAIAVHIPSSYGISMTVFDFLKSNAKRLEKLGDQNSLIIMANLTGTPEGSLSTIEITEKTLYLEIRSNTTVFVDRMTDPPDNFSMNARWEYLKLGLEDEEKRKNPGKSPQDFGLPSNKEASYAYLLTGMKYPFGFLPVSNPENPSFRGYFSHIHYFNPSKMTEEQIEAAWAKETENEIDEALLFFDAKGDKGKYQNSLIKLLNILVIDRAAAGYDDREWFARIAKQAGASLSNESLEMAKQILLQSAFIDLEKEHASFVDWLTVLSDESVAFDVRRLLADEIVQDSEREPRLVKSFNSPYRIHTIFDRDARWLNQSKLEKWLTQQRTIEYIKFFQDNSLWTEEGSALIRKLNPEVADKINRSEVRANTPQDPAKLIEDLSDPDIYVKALAFKKLTGLASSLSQHSGEVLQKTEEVLTQEDYPGSFLSKRAVAFLGELAKSFPEAAAQVLENYFNKVVTPLIHEKPHWAYDWGTEALNNLVSAAKNIGVLGLPILSAIAKMSPASKVLQNIAGAYGDLAVKDSNDLLMDLLQKHNQEEVIKVVLRELLRVNPSVEQRGALVLDLLDRKQYKTVFMLLESMDSVPEEILSVVIADLNKSKPEINRLDFEFGLQALGKAGKNSSQTVEFLTALLREGDHSRSDRDRAVIQALMLTLIDREKIWNALNELYSEYLKKGTSREFIIEAMAVMNSISDRTLGPKAAEISAAYRVMLKRDQQKLEAKIKTASAGPKAGVEDSVAPAKEPMAKIENSRKLPSQVNTKFAAQSPKIARFADQIAEEFYAIGILKGSLRELQAIIQAAVSFSRDQKVLRSVLDELSLEIPGIKQGDGTNLRREAAAGRLIVAWVVVKYDLEPPARIILNDYIQGLPGSRVVATLTEIGIPRLRAEAILTEVHTYAWESYLHFPDSARFIDKFVLIRGIEDFLEKEGFDNKLIELIAKYLNQQRVTRAEVQEYHEAIRDWDKPFWNAEYKKAWEDASFALDMSDSDTIEDRDVHQQIRKVMHEMRRLLKHRAIIHHVALELEDLLKEDPNPDSITVKSYRTYLEDLKDQLIFRDGRSLEETLQFKPTMSGSSADKVDAHYTTIIIRLSSVIDRVGHMIRSEVRSVEVENFSKLAKYYSGYLVLEQMRRDDPILFEGIVKNLAARHGFAVQKPGLEVLPSEVRAFLDSEDSKSIRTLFESSEDQTESSRMIRVKAASASELAVPILRSILDRNFKLIVVVDHAGEAQDLKIEARAYTRGHLHLTLNEGRFQVVVQDARGIVPTLNGLIVKGEKTAIVADGEKGDEITRDFDKLNASAGSLRLIDNSKLTLAEEMALSAALLDQPASRRISQHVQVQFTSRHLEGPFAGLLAQAKALAAIFQAA